MAKITPIDIIKGVSRKIGGGNSKEYFATNKCSYHIHLAKRVNSSVQAPFNLRSTSVQAPFKLRSSSVRAPFKFRSFSVDPPLILRSSSVCSPFVLRSFSVRRSKIDRRMIEKQRENHRRQDGDVTKL